MTTPTHAREELDRIAQTVDTVSAADATVLAELRTELLGRKAGKLTRILRSLGSLPADERRRLGARANQIKQALEAAIAEREQVLEDQSRRVVDVDGTMPARQAWRGARHPVLAVVDEICEIFKELGFTRVSGPEAETEDYNFTKLNMPLDHPAADEHDTFYLGRGTLLRTHTSPVQARVMEQYQPPIRIVVPGRVYRRDAFEDRKSVV